MAEHEKDKPDAVGIAQKRQAPAVEVCRDVYGGTLRMRSKGEKYLPRFPKESHEGYDIRLGTAVLFNAFRRTIDGCAGMVFRKDLKLGEDVPKTIQEHAENIDTAGRHIDVFARDLFEQELIDGHVHIFVDWQKIQPGQLQTLADERELGARPYWIAIRKGQVLRARGVNVGGRIVLTRFAYIDSVTKEDGAFGEKEVQQIRDYKLALTSEDGGPQQLRPVFAVYEKRKTDTGAEEWMQIETGTMSIGRIPLATAYARRVGFQESEPPLLDLAIENVRHYQLRSDRDKTLHIASTPIPVTIGLENGGDLNIGVDRGFNLPIGGGAEYLETEGHALEHSRDELRDTLALMAVLGLQMLQRETRAAETAESKRIDKSEQDSRLSVAARGAQDAFEEALQFHAEWLKLPSGGSIEINRDFERQLLDAGMVKELGAAVAESRLSLETYWDRLVEGEVLPESFDAELELDRLAAAGLGREDDEDEEEEKELPTAA